MSQHNQTSATGGRVSSEEKIASRKAMNRKRYERRYARHQPAPASTRDHSDVPVRDPRCVLRGVPEYLQQVVRMKYGAKGTWGHGRYVSATRKGPGRRRVPLAEQNKPAGSRLIRKFYENLS